MVKNFPAMQESRVQSLSWQDPLDKEMATHSMFLSGESHGQGEPGELQSVGLKGVGYDWKEGSKP